MGSTQQEMTVSTLSYTELFLHPASFANGPGSYPMPTATLTPARPRHAGQLQHDKDQRGQFGPLARHAHGFLQLFINSYGPSALRLSASPRLTCPSQLQSCLSIKTIRRAFGQPGTLIHLH